MGTLKLHLGLVLGCMAVLPPLPVHATPGAQTPAGRRQWQMGLHSWVKLEPQEPGAPPNEHPATLSPGLEDQLENIRFKTEKGEEPLFAKPEVEGFLKTLQQAFAAAGRGDDVLLLSTYRRGENLSDQAKAVTVRLFRKGDALQVIVHDARADFLGAYYATERAPEFTFGSRTATGKVRLRCPGASSQRPDWLVLPDRPAPAAALPAPEPDVATPPAVKAPPAEPARPLRDPAFFEQQELRLRTLKHLRDENLISEEEYQSKRQKILDGI